MNVLYLVFKALLGGHVLSANTIANEMRCHGINPVFAGAEGAMSDEIRRQMPFEPVEIPIWHGSRQTYFTWRSLGAVRQLRHIIRQHNIDLVHAFDARSYMHAYPAALLEGVPVLATLCGGVDPYFNLPAAPSIIVFSEEQKQKMVKAFGWPEARVEVLRTRLDMRKILDKSQLLSDEEARTYGLCNELPKVMLISSFDNTKIRSIHQVLDATEQLYAQGLKFQLVLIGGKGELHDQARRRGEQICERFGADRVVFTGPVMHAFRLLQRASVVLGVGRSAFEGMIYGKPTLVVGENGFAGVVCPETVEDIGWYNFSGRNQQQEVAADLLAAELGSLMRDADRSRILGDFAHDFVRREIDVARGAGRIGALYQRITAPGSRLAPLKQWGSFARCLAPVAADNGLHTARQAVKAVLPAKCFAALPKKG